MRADFLPFTDRDTVVNHGRPTVPVGLLSGYADSIYIVSVDIFSIGGHG